MSYNCLCMFHNVTGFNCVYLGGRKGGRGGGGEYRTLCNSEGGRKEERREGGKEERREGKEGGREGGTEGEGGN